ncbi:MAG: sirohydrochlorin chelatase [Mycobacterium sp.]
MTLILTAHGSADPRSAANTHALVQELRRTRPGLDVEAAFCEQNAPNLRDALLGSRQPAVVVPLLLADAYHARADIPALIAESGADVRQAPVLGEDPRLLRVLRKRVAAEGVSRLNGEGGVVVAVGSSRAEANERTASVAKRLATHTCWAGVRAAFATGPNPSVAEAAEQLRRDGASRIVIAPWFLAHGRITDRVADYALADRMTMAQPLGADPLVVATVLDRFDDVMRKSGAA